MSYRYYVTKRSPVSLWMLDDTVPFQEYAGFGASGGKKTGSADPTKSIPLVAGAAWSSVFKAGQIGQFAFPLFKQGLESRPFALEAWVLPISRSDGFTSAITNTAANPSVETAIGGWGALSTAPETTISRDTTWSHVGVASAKLLKNTDSTGSVGCLIWGSATSNTRAVAAGKYVRTKVTIRNPNATSKDVVIQHFWFTAAVGANGSDVSSITTIPAGGTVTKVYTSVAPANTAFNHVGIVGANVGTNNMTLNEFIQCDAAIITIHDASSEPEPEYFDGSYPGASWAGTAHLSYSTMGVSNSPQQILSHDNVFDGLTINGKVIKFSTEYLTSGEAAVDYDLEIQRAAHVVAIHNQDHNQLWVNGELVAAVDITEEQKNDSYIAAATGNLFSGHTTSTQEIAMNAVAFYPSLSAEQIRQNYLAGLKVIEQERVYPQYDGEPFHLASSNGAVFLEESWVDKSDFLEGKKTNVEYADDQINPAFSAGVSIAGDWTVAVPLDARNDTSIYGVMIEWSGSGVDVDVSLDGTSWSQAYNGELVSIIPNGYDPSNKDLQIRVSFAAGVDDAYLESLAVVGFRNNTLKNTSARPITISYPAAPRNDYEPILYRDDNGIALNGGTLTIGADSSGDPTVARTLELWIKPISGTPTISVSGTKYRNGAADSTLPVGEWSLIHYVSGSNIAGSITVSGDCIVGQATIYPSALTATEVEFLFKSYTGVPVLSFIDSNTIQISESVSPVSIYAHDWSIDAAG